MATPTVVGYVSAFLESELALARLASDSLLGIILRFRRRCWRRERDASWPRARFLLERFSYC